MEEKGSFKTQLWECKRCEHRWANRKKRKPLVCPSCKSYLWDEDRR